MTASGFRSSQTPPHTTLFPSFSRTKGILMSTHTPPGEGGVSKKLGNKLENSEISGNRKFRRRRRKFLRIQLEISRNPCKKHGGFLFISSCILKKFACGGEISYFRLFPSCSPYFRVSTRTKYFLHDFSPYYNTEFLRELNIFISEFLRELFFARFSLYFRVFFLQLLRELNWGKSPAAGLKIIIL